MDEETEAWRNQEADLRSKAGTQIRSSDIKQGPFAHRALQY